MISVVIIAKNEEDNLNMSLPKLGWCNDVVVIDDNSTDKTKEVAESFNASVFQRTFDGFGTQKQFAVAQTKNDWVLNIDADELLTDELMNEIQQLSLHDNSIAYELPIRHVFLGKVFRYGKESKYYHLRLFNKTNSNFDDAKVHEKVKHQGKTVKLQNVILHYSYKNLTHYFEKFNLYSSIGAQKLKEKGKSRSVILSMFSFPFYFIKHYVIYLNCLNGKEGFIWSWLNACYHVVKYLKLHELNKSSKK